MFQHPTDKSFGKNIFATPIGVCRPSIRAMNKYYNKTLHYRNSRCFRYGKGELSGWNIITRIYGKRFRFNFDAF